MGDIGIYDGTKYGIKSASDSDGTFMRFPVSKPGQPPARTTHHFSVSTSTGSGAKPMPHPVTKSERVDETSPSRTSSALRPSAAESAVPTTTTTVVKKQAVNHVFEEYVPPSCNNVVASRKRRKTSTLRSDNAKTFERTLVMSQPVSTPSTSTASRNVPHLNPNAIMPPVSVVVEPVVPLVPTERETSQTTVPSCNSPPAWQYNTGAYVSNMPFEQLLMTIPVDEEQVLLDSSLPFVNAPQWSLPPFVYNYLPETPTNPSTTLIFRKSRRARRHDRFSTSVPPLENVAASPNVPKTSEPELDRASGPLFDMLRTQLSEGVNHMTDFFYHNWCLGDRKKLETLVGWIGKTIRGKRFWDPLESVCVVLGYDREQRPDTTGASDRSPGDAKRSSKHSSIEDLQLFIDATSSGANRSPIVFSRPIETYLNSPHSFLRGPNAICKEFSCALASAVEAAIEDTRQSSASSSSVEDAMSYRPIILYGQLNDVLRSWSARRSTTFRPKPKKTADANTLSDVFGEIISLGDFVDPWRNTDRSRIDFDGTVDEGYQGLHYCRHCGRSLVDDSDKSGELEVQSSLCTERVNVYYVNNDSHIQGKHAPSSRLDINTPQSHRQRRLVYYDNDRARPPGAFEKMMGDIYLGKGMLQQPAPHHFERQSEMWRIALQNIMASSLNVERSVLKARPLSEADSLASLSFGIRRSSLPHERTQRRITYWLLMCIASGTLAYSRQAVALSGETFINRAISIDAAVETIKSTIDHTCDREAFITALRSFVSRVTSDFQDLCLKHCFVIKKTSAEGTGAAQQQNALLLSILSDETHFAICDHLGRSQVIAKQVSGSLPSVDEISSQLFHPPPLAKEVGDRTIPDIENSADSASLPKRSSPPLPCEISFSSLCDLAMLLLRPPTPSVTLKTESK